MSPEQFTTLMTQMEGIIIRVVKDTVNGKIDGLRGEFNEYVEDDLKWKEDHHKFIEEKVKPIVKSREFWNTGGARAKQVFASFALVAGGVAGIVYLWGLVVNHF